MLCRSTEHVIDCQIINCINEDTVSVSCADMPTSLVFFLQCMKVNWRYAPGVSEFMDIWTKILFILILPKCAKTFGTVLYTVALSYPTVSVMCLFC